MIELIKEKQFNSRDPRLGLPKSTIMFDKFRIPKFTSSAFSPVTTDTRLIIYLGMNTGNIISMTLFKQKSMFYKYEEFLMYKYPKDQEHKGPVSVMICEIIDMTPILFSGGVDGTIKLWLGDPELREKDMNHQLKTISAHKGTVVSLAFSKTTTLLISSGSDMTIKVFRIKYYYDKIIIPSLELIQTITDLKVTPVQLNKEKDLRYWITTLSLKETDIIELYAGDMRGRVLIYHFIDDNYIKYRGKEYVGLKRSSLKNTFNFIREVNVHKKWAAIKVVHSKFENLIYSAGYDNHVVCYNVKNNTKMFDLVNTNSKTHYSSMNINHDTQELVIGDQVGNLTFLKLFNKSEFKIKATDNAIIDLLKLEIFNDQEHLLTICDEYITLFKVGRKTKISNVQHHDAELLKLFSIEPVKEGLKIIEDAKIISCSYDNTIKMWDFLTMECINLINGPELPKRNVEIRSVAYLHDSSLIAIGSDLGNIFFWDLNRSEYLKNDYEKYIKHKVTVTGMTSFIIRGKDNLNYKEYLISCSNDGLMLIWEIQKTEIKEAKKRENHEEDDKFLILNSQSYKNNARNKKLIDMQRAQELLVPIRETKNYKCSPQIKVIMNSMSLIKQELKFTCVAFQPHQINRVIYTGCTDAYIYLWDFTKGTSIGKVKSSNMSVTCFIFDKNFLISGGVGGYIDIWNLPQEKENLLPTLIYSLKDPDVKGNTNVQIHDLLMLSDSGILVSCTNMRKVNFWKYEKEMLLTSVSKEQEVSCLGVIESYGKLVCGTKDRTILEINLVEVLDGIGYKHEYEKYPFLNNPESYIEDERDKAITSNKIMDSLTRDNDLFS